MIELNAEDMGRLVNTVAEALIELGKRNENQSVTEYPIFFEDLVPAIKKLKADNEAMRGEIKMMGAVQDRLEDDLAQQFDQMQASLIAYVMWKCGRKTLAIDSREISDPNRFAGQAITVTAIDAFTTSYKVAPLKDKKND